MSYSLENLGLIAGANSTSGRLWKYKEAATIAAMRASAYFNSSVDHGVKDGDVLMLIGSDAIGFSQVNVSGATYTLDEDITSA